MNLYFSKFDCVDSSQLSTLRGSNVTRLHFDKCTIQPNCEDAVVDAVAQMSNLVCCIIRPACSTTKSFLDSILKALNCIGPSLTHFVFYDCCNSVDLEAFLRQNTSLTTMKIVRSSRNEADLMSVVSAMSSHPRLQLLMFKQCVRLDKVELEKDARARASRSWLGPSTSFCFRQRTMVNGQSCSDSYSTYGDVLTKKFNRFSGSVPSMRNQNDISTAVAFVATQQRNITIADWNALFSTQAEKIYMLCRHPEDSNYSLVNLPKALTSFSGTVALDKIEFDGPFSSLNAGVNDDVAVLLAQCNNLVDICIRNRAFNYAQTLKLLTLLNQSERKNMRRIVIKANNFVIDDPIIEECAKLVEKNNSFRMLRLSRNRTYGSQPVGMRLLATAIAKHQLIESVTINNVHFYGDMFDFLIGMMRHNPSLRKLKIRCTWYTSVETQERLIRALVETNRLVSFHVMAWEQDLINCHERDAEIRNPKSTATRLEWMRMQMQGNTSLLSSDLPETFPTLCRNAQLQWQRQFCKT